jgi:CRP/FNR family transcriptional regulator, cyclic AMP receptor protein
MQFAAIVQPRWFKSGAIAGCRGDLLTVARPKRGLRPKVSDKHWYLKNCRLLSRLPEAALGKLEACSRSNRFKSGEVIYIPIDRADSVLIVVSGQVKLCHVTPEGKESILAFIEPGELFGEMSLAGGSVREELAIATCASTIVLVPGRAMEAMMNEHAGLALGVTQLLGFRRRRIERRLKSLLFRSSRDRLVQLLVELAEEYGDKASEGIEIRLRLSHQDLANIIGSTRETVTNTLGQLQEEGLVLLGRQRVTVRSLERLLAAADTHSPPAPN